MLKVFRFDCSNVRSCSGSKHELVNNNHYSTTENSKHEPRETTGTAPKQTTTTHAPGSEGVLAAFNTLLDGIRHASVDEVMSAYWNNPGLNLFNYNGSVTKGWQQVRKNRESSYPEIKDVKLEVRDVVGDDAGNNWCDRYLPVDAIAKL